MHKLKEIRIKKGLLQKDVAEFLGMTQQGYSKLETGVRKLDHQQITKLCLALDITPDELLDFEESYKRYTDELLKLKEDEVKQ